MIAESLARRYSVALFNLSRERNELQRVYAEFSLVNNLLRKQEKFRYFLFTPKVESGEKKRVLKIVFEKEMSRTLLYFLFLLLDKKRQTLALKMYDHFVTLYNNYYKKTTITVRPASALSPETHSAIKRVFEKALKRTVTINEEVDQLLIGGMQILVNNTVYDASIANSLHTMKKMLLAQ